MFYLLVLLVPLASIAAATNTYTAATDCLAPEAGLVASSSPLGGLRFRDAFYATSRSFQMSDGQTHVSFEAFRCACQRQCSQTPDCIAVFLYVAAKNYICHGLKDVGAGLGSYAITSESWVIHEHNKTVCAACSNSSSPLFCSGLSQPSSVSRNLHGAVSCRHPCGCHAPSRQHGAAHLLALPHAHLEACAINNACVL